MINIFHLHNFPFKNISEWTAKSNLEFKKKEYSFFLCKKVNIMKRQQQCKQHFLRTQNTTFSHQGWRVFSWRKFENGPWRSALMFSLFSICLTNWGEIFGGFLFLAVIERWQKLIEGFEKVFVMEMSTNWMKSIETIRYLRHY